MSIGYYGLSDIYGNVAESMRGGPLLGISDLPLHDGSHFTLTGSGIAEEW
jgi:hypothetical protein